MPWHIESDNPECTGYAVVKDSNGELEGCHRTRGQAERQMAALYAAEPEARAPGVPSEAMREEARRGLEWRAEFGRGGTAVGVARARDIANGRTLSPSTIRRMRSYFARHEIDKEGEGFSPGEDGYPSAGRIAWALWGGDPGKAWVEDQIRALEDRQEDDEMEDDDEDETEAIVVTDIDGTIVRNGTQPIQPTIDKINALGFEVYVISGRDPSRRDETERLLDRIGLIYDDLYLVGSQAAKRPIIENLAAEYRIVYAFENDETVRGYYKAAGAENVAARSRVEQVEEILAELRAARYSSQ